MTLADIAYFPLSAGWACPGCNIAHNCANGCPVCRQEEQISLGSVLNRVPDKVQRAVSQADGFGDEPFSSDAHPRGRIS